MVLTTKMIQVQFPTRKASSSGIRRSTSRLSSKSSSRSDQVLSFHRSSVFQPSPKNESVVSSQIVRSFSSRRRYGGGNSSTLTFNHHIHVTECYVRWNLCRFRSSRNKHHPCQQSRSASSSTRSSFPSAFWAAVGNFGRKILVWYTKQLETYPMTTKCLSSGIVASMGDIICQSMTTLEADEELRNTGDDGDQYQQQQQQQHRQQPLSQAEFLDWLNWDWKRTGRFFIMGCFWVAPCTHYWYQTLNTRLVPGLNPTVRKVATRVLLDQVLFAPLFCPSFMGLLWLLEGRGGSYENWFRPSHDQHDSSPPPTSSSSSLGSSGTSPSSSLEELGKDLWDVTPSIIQANWLVWVPANAINFSIVPLQFQVLYGNVVALCWNVFLSYKSQWKRQNGSESQSE